MVRRTVGKWSASRYATVAVAGVAGLLVLAGCGQSRLGAAALYGNQRVSTTRLAAEVSNLNVAYQKYQHKTQISYQPADMPREVLSWLLRFATANQLAADRGIKVTPAQAEHELKVETANVKQGGDTLPEAAVLNGLPPDLLPQLGSWISIQVQLDSQLDNGTAPKTQAASTALTTKANHLQCLAAKRLNIKVNPQYGVYDFASYAVVATPSTLAASSPAPVPSASPTAAPQLTPKC
jgi:hypothetical protein